MNWLPKRRERAVVLSFMLFAITCLSEVNAQDKDLEWKFPAPKMASTKDKATNLTFYSLEQGVLAAFKEVEGASGAVVVLPGPRLGEEERKKTISHGIDPDRMLTAMAVALVLPLFEDPSDTFVSKEDWKGTDVYRWKTRNGAEACASALPLRPYSDLHDVLFVSSCALKPKEGAFIITRNGERPMKGYEDYIPRTLKKIIRAHSDPNVLNKNEGSMILTGDTFSSRVKVVYTGSSRKVALPKKQHLDMLVTSFGVDQKVIDRYDTEVLFLEQGDEHWLPVDRRLIQFLEKEVPKGEEITVYVEWVGARKINGNWEWIFMVHEFQKQ